MEGQTETKGETMFPGANARMFYNEDGEPSGWDYPDRDEDAAFSDFSERMADDEMTLAGCMARGVHGDDCDGTDDPNVWRCYRCDTNFSRDESGEIVFTVGQSVATVVSLWHGHMRPAGTRGTIMEVVPGFAGESYSLVIETAEGPVFVWPTEIVQTY